MKLLLILLLSISLYASQILSYNVYDRTDRVDLMITFDTPYNGVIKESHNRSKIIIKLENSTIEASKIKKISSPFLQSLTITPLDHETQIMAITTQPVKFIASKTSDGYGLRLRFVPSTLSTTQQSVTKENQSSTNETNYLSNLPTKKSDDLTQSYIIVTLILLIGIFILFYLKRKTTPKKPLKANTPQTKESQWLFNATTTEEKPTNNNVSIRFQKAIDDHSSVVMLDFGEESYLVLMGNSNILLDKFHENRPTSQTEFESILQSRHEELEEFLHGPKEHVTYNEEKEPLQAYKERAASIVYNEE